MAMRHQAVRLLARERLLKLWNHHRPLRVAVVSPRLGFLLSLCCDAVA